MVGQRNDDSTLAAVVFAFAEIGSISTSIILRLTSHGVDTVSCIIVFARLGLGLGFGLV